MSGNTIGKIFRFISFGESHGKCIGGVIDGCPSGMLIDIDRIKHELSRRKPQSRFSTTRMEDDVVNIVSGVFEGKTLGTPIAFYVENKEQRSEDYEILKDAYRPSHADYTYQTKYGIRDYRGGGRASARETVARVVAGSIAKQLLNQRGITITAYTSQIGNVCVDRKWESMDLSVGDANPFYCPDEDKAGEMAALLETVADNGNTVGGVVTCVVKGCPVGLGEPIFDKLQAHLARAMMSIPSAKGFDYGDGFEAASMFGSNSLDLFNADFSTRSNHSGGIQGGISNGADVIFRVAFKPIASISQPISVVDERGYEKVVQLGGRHDCCQVPRAVPVVEAMAALVLADMMLCYDAYRK